MSLQFEDPTVKAKALWRSTYLGPVISFVAIAAIGIGILAWAQALDGYITKHWH